jgi:hypothetical protein
VNANVDSQLDHDTETKGVDGPFERWESDHTALVHVLWSLKSHGLITAEDPDTVATQIMSSRWFAAARDRGTFQARLADLTTIAELREENVELLAEVKPVRSSNRGFARLTAEVAELREQLAAAEAAAESIAADWAALPRM